MHVDLMEFPVINRATDGMGGSGHPSIQKHYQMAEQLSKAISHVCPNYILSPKSDLVQSAIK